MTSHSSVSRSAIADVGVSASVRQLIGALPPFAPSKPRMSGADASERVLTTQYVRSIGFDATVSFLAADSTDRCNTMIAA
jgi:hypothetical protein